MFSDNFFPFKWNNRTQPQSVVLFRVGDREYDKVAIVFFMLIVAVYEDDWLFSLG